jgi:predicted ATPase
LTEAAELYRGDFLAGFTLRDSPDFDDWQLAQSEHLRRELTRVLHRLTQLQASAGDWDSSADFARRVLTLDPLDESAHRLLMSVYAWAGRRSAALHQYRECVRTLDRELGVAPLEETTRLYQGIREGGAPAAPPVPDRRPQDRSMGLTPTDKIEPARPRPSELPLVGRSSQWEVLARTYSGLDDVGHLVVLEGEAGIGKTRLADEFSAHVRALGGTMVTAKCFSGEVDLSYGPFVEVLRRGIAAHGDRLDAVPDLWLSEAGRLVTEMAEVRSGIPLAPPLDTPGAQGRFFEAVSQTVLAVTRGARPGILVLDDLQWADASSLDLLTYMVRRLDRLPLLILGTWRAEQVPAGDRRRLLLADAQSAGTGKLVSLPRLSRADVAEMVRAALPGGRPVPDNAGERLYEKTEGLPFFLAEYLAALTVEGEPSGDSWSMPSGVRELLRSRLASVTDAGRQLLDTAAVIGRSFDFDTLRAASGRGDVETVAELESLIAVGLILEQEEVDEEADLVYDFIHEQLRALTYEQTSLARRRLLHRRVADALAAGTNARQGAGPAGLVAHHYLMAREDARAATYFSRAGEEAAALFANAEALAHYRQALDLGHDNPAAMHEAIGDLYTLTGDYGAAIADLETAAALAGRGPSSDVERKLGNVYLRRGDWEIAESHFRAALASLDIEGHSGERSRLSADLSLTAHRRGRIGEAAALAGDAVGLAEAAGDSPALAQAHNILGILARGRGELASARDHLTLSLEVAEQLDDPTATVAALNNLALSHGALGEVSEALSLAERALDLCVSQGDRHREAAVRNNIADLLHAAGESDAAMSHLKQAVSIFAEIGAGEATRQPEIWKLIEW